MENVRNGLLGLGARTTDIIVLTDTPFKQMSQIMKDLVTEVHRNESFGTKTFIFVYYAGHGAMVSGQSVLVLNEPRRYPIEK